MMSASPFDLCSLEVIPFHAIKLHNRDLVALARCATLVETEITYSSLYVHVVHK